MERKILIFLLFEGVMNAVSGQTPVLQIIQPATEVGSNFTLQCTVTINKAIEFQLNNTGQGSCSAPFLGMLGTCTPSDITQNLTTAVTSWTISPAQPEHDGKWICALGSTDSNEADLQIYQLPGSIITQNGISSDVIVNDTSSYPIVVEVDCLFSGNGPIVELQFAATVNTSVAMTCTTLSTVCSACTGCSAYNCSIILNKALISGQISVNTAYTLYIKVGVTGTTEKFTKPISSPHTVKFERTSQTVTTEIPSTSETVETGNRFDHTSTTTFQSDTTDITIKSSTENGFTYESVHVTQKVTTPQITVYDSFTDHTIGFIIALSFTGILFLTLTTITCFVRNNRTKRKKENPIETSKHISINPKVRSSRYTTECHENLNQNATGPNRQTPHQSDCSGTFSIDEYIFYNGKEYRIVSSVQVPYDSYDNHNH